MIKCSRIDFTTIEQNKNENTNDYHDRAYKVFKKEIIDEKLIFNGKEVRTREYPIIDNKVQSFFHIISEESKKGVKIRLYKPERVRMIPCISKMIKNYTECQTCNDNCSKIKVWSAPFKGKQFRTKIFFEDENYIIILEERKDYYLLVSAYVVDRQDRKIDLLKEYNKYK